ncbi:hypothetical protein E4U41_006170 [Claviceps citrina]|nr:hypothetical protein E4U41_006170 [Claviceps citrina]
MYGDEVEALLEEIGYRRSRNLDDGPAAANAVALMPDHQFWRELLALLQIIAECSDSDARLARLVRQDRDRVGGASAAE